MSELESLLNNIADCRICEEYLSLGPRPVIQMHPDARILIAGQAPGTKVHASGIPFDDPSGNRLRELMGISKDVFYGPKKIALVPMGFCYPGKGKSGDLPPRQECEPAWRQQVLMQLKNIKITLVLGKYAQNYHFGKSTKTLTDLVKSWPSYWPERIPLPHPSPRNNIWLRKNPWFETELLPPLKESVKDALK